MWASRPTYLYVVRNQHLDDKHKFDTPKKSSHPKETKK